MAKRAKKVSTGKAGKSIKLAIKQLKAARATATAGGKKRIDLHVKALTKSYAGIRSGCGRGEFPWVQ